MPYVMPQRAGLQKLVFTDRTETKITGRKHWESEFYITWDLFKFVCHGFPAGTVAEGAPIIPISAQLKYNIEVVCEYIVKKIPVPIRDFISEPRLIGTYCSFLILLPF